MEFDWDAIDQAIYGMTPEQYKAYFQQMQSRKLSRIDSIAKKGTFDKTAYDLAQRNINIVQQIC
ncbi:hypothetical protein [Chitinophaga pinensis]|uniref:Uncharacterized protein n=1 Tax=Chitinophaga pinensis TaxID=79329 RepID=A0A5C6LXN2_9BACT|nr:hypothetical protein [Chitinophaga pinensis]TWW00096.1 hypothetical protein FEF09_12150 [Chitinophaga pinensis]